MSISFTHKGIFGEREESWNTAVLVCEPSCAMPNHLLISSSVSLPPVLRSVWNKMGILKEHYCCELNWFLNVCRFVTNRSRNRLIPSLSLLNCRMFSCYCFCTGNLFVPVKYIEEKYIHIYMLIITSTPSLWWCRTTVPRYTNPLPQSTLEHAYHKIIISSKVGESCMQISPITHIQTDWSCDFFRSQCSMFLLKLFQRDVDSTWWWFWRM